MDCIYCGNNTLVTNSRPQKRRNAVWRRRQCEMCRQIFTTIESANFEASVLVNKNAGHAEPFQRDILFISVYEACRHRKDAGKAAGALTDTIMAGLFPQFQKAEVSIQRIKEVATEVLTRFDRAAGTAYAAFHPI